MSDTIKFANCDTSKPDGFYVQFARIELPDDDTSPDDFDCYGEDQKVAWRAGAWQFIGIRAQARCLIVKNGVGTYLNFESAGLWGIESNSDADFLRDVFETECAELKRLIAAMVSPIYETERAS